MLALDLKSSKVWLVVGSQTLYGEKTLAQVRANSSRIVKALNASPSIPVTVGLADVLTSPEQIRRVLMEANADEACIGVIAWMHTFSPAQMWIPGLKALQKPLLHLDTQFNAALPYDTIDMDFMNLNQSAHGDLEFGHICARMGVRRKIVVGHWSDPEVKHRIGTWTRAAAAWHDMQGMKIARFGDNMRQVAVTEGDKVEANIVFGFSVQGFAVGELAQRIEKVKFEGEDPHMVPPSTRKLVDMYHDLYEVIPDPKIECRPVGERVESRQMYEAAYQEIAIRRFLEEGGFSGFTTTFEDLHGLDQLPGLAAQRLMADGYGYGAEGDWKTAALVRAMKVMGAGLPGGASFMEQYTYHLKPEPAVVLGAHMLEVCPSLAADKPALEIHPLSIGGKADPARLVFNVKEGSAVMATIADMGNHFRLIANDVAVIAPPQDLPQLPVARAVWHPMPDFKTATERWIEAGGGHHACLSQQIHLGCLEDFAQMAGVELVVIC